MYRHNNFRIIKIDGKVFCIQTGEESSQYTSASKQVVQFFRSVFLPQDYPHSVSSDYLEYQLWDTLQVSYNLNHFLLNQKLTPIINLLLSLQAFASSLSGSLSTKAVLEGIGVGNSDSTPLAATLMWLIKDGTGMVGRIIFAWSKG